MSLALVAVNVVVPEEVIAEPSVGPGALTLNGLLAAGVPPVQPPPTVKPPVVSFAVTTPVDVPAVTCAPT